MRSEENKPLIVQRDRSIFLEVEHPLFAEARDRLVRFAELEKSPRYVQVFRITRLSLWNAAAAGLTVDEIVGFLSQYSRCPVPTAIRDEIRDWMQRYGWLRLVRDGEKICLEVRDSRAAESLGKWRSLREHCEDEVDVSALSSADSNLAESPVRLPVRAGSRGPLKMALVKRGFPVEDVAGYAEGAPLRVELRDRCGCSGEPFALRDYQREAVEAFHDGGRTTGGSGVVALPCGAGKTIVALGAIARLGVQTLVLSTNTTALRQWKRELLDKTDVDPELVGEYSGEEKEIRPITLTTYQMLTYRDRTTKEFLHYRLFSARRWGLIVYDEVHLLPAPVFRLTATVQATRRLGLTATLVREDGREAEVFSLVGPKKFDVPWRDLEREGWIAGAQCVEMRVPAEARQSEERQEDTNRRELFREAAVNPAKLEVVRRLVARHPNETILVIGQYLDQLREIHREMGAPLITGRTPNRRREELYELFRSGRLPVLIVSKVGNFAVDLPDANIAIQVSGTFGSRQEEAQRLGRILRPKTGGRPVIFYSLVTQDSTEQEFAEKRQRFLAEQGYQYTILDSDALGGDPAVGNDPDSGEDSTGRNPDPWSGILPKQDSA